MYKKKKKTKKNRTRLNKVNDRNRAQETGTKLGILMYKDKQKTNQEETWTVEYRIDDETKAMSRIFSNTTTV